MKRVTLRVTLIVTLLAVLVLFARLAPVHALTFSEVKINDVHYFGSDAIDTFYSRQGNANSTVYTESWTVGSNVTVTGRAIVDYGMLDGSLVPLPDESRITVVDWVLSGEIVDINEDDPRGTAYIVDLDSSSVLSVMVYDDVDLGNPGVEDDVLSGLRLTVLSSSQLDDRFINTVTLIDDQNVSTAWHLNANAVFGVDAGTPGVIESDTYGDFYDIDQGLLVYLTLTAPSGLNNWDADQRIMYTSDSGSLSFGYDTTMTAPVPSPASVLLVSGGLALIGLWRRVRR